MKATSSLTPSPTQLRPSSSTTAARTTPAVIPLDYNYQTMSPASSLSRNFFQQTQARSTGSANVVNVEIEMADSQYNSIFGDPVPPPPPEDFFGSQFPHATEFLRRPSMIQLSSEEEVELSGGRSNMRRLFSDVPFSSSISRRLSNVSYATRLQPPDIQILPHSSGGSSSEARDSPNFALLTPDDILRRPLLYDIVEPADTTELHETLTISDATGLREYSEATRRVSNFSEDFKSNVGSLGSPPPDVPELPKTYTRQLSNESCSSSEWFRPSSHGLPNFPEFSKMPRLRPSSKNVMSIKRDEMPMHHSPVAAMINDSNGSSSGEERLMDTTVVLEHATVPLPDTPISPVRQPDPAATYRYESDVGLLLSPQQYLQQRRSSTVDDVGPNIPPPPAPPPLPPVPPVPPPPDLGQPLSLDVKEPTLKCDLSPAIITDSISTGGEFRVDQARLHKKTAFTIISDKSPTTQDSRVQSAVAQHHKSEMSPFLGYGFKDASKSTATSESIPRTDQALQHNQRRKSFSATQLKLPQLRQNQLTSEDSPRPSVQFNMTGRRSPSKMPHKGILQHRESVSSLQDPDATLPASQIIPPKPLPASALACGPKMKSYETLPLLTDPYRTAIPRLNRSSLDLRRESSSIPSSAIPRALKPNPNPTRKHRGLLRVINSADSSSRIPLRSKWSSMEDVTIEPGKRRPSLMPFSIKARRRSSSTSPERRSSTQTASDRRSSNLSSVTTSDFSFRRPSLTPQSQRRKSIVPGSTPAAKRRQSIVPPQATTAKASLRPSRSKIAKPSTLSPIIGTPNKDSNSLQSPAVAPSVPVSDSASDSVSRRGSISKIPIRNGVESRSNSRLSTHADSRHESRSSSPVKDFSGVQLPHSRPTSRAASSRSPSRATVRTESRASSHGTQMAAASRSTSRASTKPISRGGSRASSRQSSRMEQARSVANSRSNSRSNSRLSQSSVLKIGSVSVSPDLKSISQTRRRKSVSLSPRGSRRTVLIRRNSLSPKRSKKGKSPEQQRRNSRSRIPMRAISGGKTSPATKSPPKSKNIPTTATTPSEQRTSPTQRSSVRGKEPASAKKAPTSVRKPESSVKRTPSSVKKTPTDATKKPSPLQKTASRTSFKREASNVQKKSGGAATAAALAPAATKSLKKEASTLSLKRGGTAGDTKRTPSALSRVKTAAKVMAAKKTINGGNTNSTAAAGEVRPTARTPSAGATKAETPKKAATSEKAEEKGEKAESTGTGTDSGSAASTGSLKRQVTKLRLIRAGSKMSLLSRKRSESNLSRKFDAETASIAEEIDLGAHTIEMLPQNSEQLLNTADDISTLPSAILEKSQKTLENVQKTVTEATDEIQKTINENLTDLKSLAETDVSRTTTGGAGGIASSGGGGGGVVGGGYESAASPSPSVTTVVENKSGKGASVSRMGTAEGVGAVKSTTSITSPTNTEPKQKSPAPPTQPIEAAVSVVNGARKSAAAGVSNSHKGITSDTSLATAAGTQHLSPGDSDADLVERNYEMGIKQDKTDAGVSGVDGIADADTDAGGSADARRSPDGQGGSITGSGDKTGSQEFLEKKHKDDDGDASQRSCCSCCTKLCMPCRRMRCSRCCRRKKPTSALTTASNNNNDDDVQPVLTPPSSATTTTNIQVVDEKRQGCWQKLKCCKRKKKKSTADEVEIMPSVQQQQQQQQMATIHEEATPTPEVSQTSSAATAKQSSKCGLCLSKFFCCRSVNKVKTTTSGGSSMMHAMNEPKPAKCCFCIPWRRKRPRGSTVGSISSGTAAWQDPERGITSTEASVLEGQDREPRPGCCRRFWCCMSCCKKKPPPIAAVSESRRASMKAAVVPEQETRRKLHVDLVEYNSKMKGAIPVLPLYLAWFCAICNTLFPGLGTLLSGIFCVCIGIPRFSHYDSAKARLGAFIINTIVAVSQFFCVLFCFVGWGWSIWWGTIMLKCARKLKKIKKVERLEMEEEQRQSDQAAAAAATAATRAVLASETEAAKQ